MQSSKAQVRPLNLRYPHVAANLWLHEKNGANVLERLLYGASLEPNVLAPSMRDRVYVGYIQELSANPEQRDADCERLPVASGYRHPNTLKLQLTTLDQSVYRDLARRMRTISGGRPSSRSSRSRTSCLLVTSTRRRTVASGRSAATATRVGSGPWRPRTAIWPRRDRHSAPGRPRRRTKMSARRRGRPVPTAGDARVRDGVRMEYGLND
jgi:hypothetical protein